MASRAGLGLAAQAEHLQPVSGDGDPARRGTGGRVGYGDDQIVINPTYAQRKLTKLDIVVAGSKDGLVMSAGHVVGKPGQQVTFRFADGKTAKGTTLGIYSPADVGLMKITDKGDWPSV